MSGLPEFIQTQTSPTTMAMVVGEASGDLLAALLIPQLQAHWPGLKLYGIGGERMVALGFDAWWPAKELAVRGYVEVLRHYRRIVGIRRELARRCRAGLQLVVGQNLAQPGYPKRAVCLPLGVGMACTPHTRLGAKR
jgi:hypothetical protein